MLFALVAASASEPTFYPLSWAVVCARCRLACQVTFSLWSLGFVKLVAGGCRWTRVCNLMCAQQCDCWKTVGFKSLIYCKIAIKSRCVEEIFAILASRLTHFVTAFTKHYQSRKCLITVTRRASLMCLCQRVVVHSVYSASGLTFNG